MVAEPGSGRMAVELGLGRMAAESVKHSLGIANAPQSRRKRGVCKVLSGHVSVVLEQDLQRGERDS